MQLKTIMVAAIICLAMIGTAVAPATYCWDDQCGTTVEQCDKETTFVLYPAENATIVKTIHGYVYVDVEPDYNVQGQLIITAYDVRLSNWHTNYEPNTQVMPNDMDNLDVIEETYVTPIKYVDINDNGIYDLYDGVVYDLDNDDAVSSGDILQTDLPAVDVYSLEEHNAGELLIDQGEFGEAWDRVNINHPARGMDLDTIGSGEASDLMKWVDADDSNDWGLDDKLYLIQPHCEIDKGLEAIGFDDSVTIGDTRVFIPADDPCIPDCGTKVVQGDHDATYMLITNPGAVLAFYSFGGDTEWYVDMDNDGFVSFGDVRLTEVSTHYEPNTKVKVCDEFDLGHDLTPSDQTIVRYAEKDDLVGYTLGDAVYIDIDDNDVVDAGDIRLVEVESYLPGFDDPFVYDAWSVVEFNDADVGDGLFGLLDDNGVREGADYVALNDLLGFIDSDCTGDWTCPDKLYIQQITGECHLDNGVTVGDLRLYVPVNDPNSPFFDMEHWHECGTKVMCCDIDVEYGVIPLFSNYDWIKFVDRNNDGEFTEGEDHVYIDMDETDDVTIGDIRLTDVTIKDAFYPNNTKVMDQHALDLGDTLLRADEFVMVSDLDLLGVVPNDDECVLCEEFTPFTVSWFDTDCSGDWTCPDALFLSIDDEFWNDDMAVTHKDVRLFIPTSMEDCVNIDPSEEDSDPEAEGAFWETYDTMNPYGVIVKEEVINAINDFFDQEITLEQVIEVIDKYFDPGL